MQTVNIQLYRWAGAWGPFKVSIPCGECSLTRDVLKDTFKNELDGVPVNFEIRDWLSCWWQPLQKGGWHAPIVMVEGKDAESIIKLNDASAFEIGQTLEFKAWMNFDGTLIGIKVEVVF